MIYTCTLNPSIDYFVGLNEFNVGGLNRVISERKSPGGKGINVSRVLQNCGIESVALGFLGGFTGQFIVDTLSDDGIRTDFIHVQGDTRINVKLHAETETEINGQGPQISSQDLNQLFEKIESLKSGDMLVLAGSIPSSLPSDLYEKIAESIKNTNVKLVVDTTKDLLKSVLPYKPFLIKPNHHELGELFDVTIETIQDAIPYGKKLLEMGAKHVIVSMADKGSLLFYKDGTFYSTVPNGKLKNSVGAGDSVVAGFIASYEKHSDSLEAFRYGAAAGSATAYSEGLCTKSFIEELALQIKVETI